MKVKDVEIEALVVILVVIDVEQMRNHLGLGLDPTAWHHSHSTPWHETDQQVKLKGWHGRCRSDLHEAHNVEHETDTAGDVTIQLSRTTTIRLCYDF